MPAGPRHRLLALPAIAGALLLAGCGGDDESGTEALASLTPPDAPLFVEGVIRPEGEDAEAIESFAERVGGIADPGAEITAELDASFSENGLEITYADDIEPWLGTHGAAFVSSFSEQNPDFAVMVETTDAGAAEDFLAGLAEQDPAADEERSYEGVDYRDVGSGLAAGVVDESALVFGTENALKVAVDASQGESLAESEDYSQRVEDLPDDVLGSMFVEPAAAIEASIAQGGIDPAQARLIQPLLGGPLSQPVAATLTATTDSASLDIAASIEEDASLSAESPLLEGLPGGSWLAAAMPDVGASLSHALDQLSSSGVPGSGQMESEIREATGLDLDQDVLEWMGDAATFVQGTAAPGFSAGLIAQTSDPEAPRKMLAVVQRLAERDSGLRSSGPPEGAEYGFSIGIPGVGGGAEAGVVGDELVAVIGATVEQALEPTETLGDNPEYEAATERLGSDFSPSLYIALPELFEVAEMGSDGDVDYEAIRPYTEAFATLVAGNQVEDGVAHSRMTVSLASE